MDMMGSRLWEVCKVSVQAGASSYGDSLVLRNLTICVKLQFHGI